jgi:TM2 domain-containing membrane protein YozV
MGRLCLAVFFFLLMGINLQAQNIEYKQYGKNSPAVNDSAKSNPVKDSNNVQVRKHKLVAALLAFPLPFGVFAAHRIYLGSSAGMPIAYIATFGGGFGVLPFIDFVLILINKDVNNYANNPHVFMWSRPKRKKK